MTSKVPKYLYMLLLIVRGSEATNMKKIRPITPWIEDELWEKWKMTLPRTIKLSRALEDLIRDDLAFKEDHKKRGKQK